MSVAEDTNRKESEDNKDIIDKDTLIYLGVGAGGLALAGVLAMVGMNWMKEQDQQKKKMIMQQQMLDRHKQEILMRQQMRQRQQQQDQEGGWPNTIPRNTVPQQSPVMELPSEGEEGEEDREDQFVGYRHQQPPPTAYNTNEQKFLISDDPMNNYGGGSNYPVIDPSSSPQQIGNKISRVMSMDGNNVPQQPQQQQPYQIRTPSSGNSSSSNDDNEDFSDLF